MAKAKVKVPKTLGGVKIPRRLRKSSMVSAFLNTELGRNILADVPVAAAGAAAAAMARHRPSGQQIAQAGEAAMEGGQRGDLHCNRRGPFSGGNTRQRSHGGRAVRLSDRPRPQGQEKGGRRSTRASVANSRWRTSRSRRPETRVRPRGAIISLEHQSGIPPEPRSGGAQGIRALRWLDRQGILR